MALYIKLFFSEPLNFPGNFANTDVNFLNWKLRKITEEEEKKQNKKNYVEQTKIVWQLLFFFLPSELYFWVAKKHDFDINRKSLIKGKQCMHACIDTCTVCASYR